LEAKIHSLPLMVIDGQILDSSASGKVHPAHLPGGPPRR